MKFLQKLLIVTLPLTLSLPCLSETIWVEYGNDIAFDKPKVKMMDFRGINRAQSHSSNQRALGLAVASYFGGISMGLVGFGFNQLRNIKFAHQVSRYANFGAGIGFGVSTFAGIYSKMNLRK